MGSLPRALDFTLTYHPSSQNVKPDALSCQFSLDHSDPDSGPILSPSCIIGAMTWQVEESVRKVQRTVLSPMEAPPNSYSFPNLSAQRFFSGATPPA